MNMIDAQQLTYYHGANLVLDHISFEVREGEKLALIGRNGSGKTTLMRLLAGIEQPSEGRLAIKKDAKVGYLEQIPKDTKDWTVWDVLSYGLRSLKECKSAMAELESRMSDPAAAGDAQELERLLRRYAVLQEQFERGEAMRWRRASTESHRGSIFPSRFMIFHSVPYRAGEDPGDAGFPAYREA